MVHCTPFGSSSVTVVARGNRCHPVTPIFTLTFSLRYRHWHHPGTGAFPSLVLFFLSSSPSSSSSPSPSLRARNNNNGGRRWLQSIRRPAAYAIYIYIRAYIIKIYMCVYMERANVSINSEFPQQYIYIFIFGRRNCIFFTLYILFLTRLSFFSTSFLRTNILIYIYIYEWLIFTPEQRDRYCKLRRQQRATNIYIYECIHVVCGKEKKELLRNLKLWFIFFHRNYVVVYIYIYIMCLSEIGTSVAHSFYYMNF